MTIPELFRRIQHAPEIYRLARSEQHPRMLAVFAALCPIAYIDLLRRATPRNAWAGRVRADFEARAGFIRIHLIADDSGARIWFDLDAVVARRFARDMHKVAKSLTQPTDPTQ